GSLRLVAPTKCFPIKAATRREFPFRLGWQALAGPFAVGDGIVPGNVHDWMIHAVVEVAFRPFWMSPVGARDEGPPNRIDSVRIDAVRKIDRLEADRKRNSSFRRHIAL